MTSKRIFQYSLIMPLLIPAIIAPLWYLRDSMNETTGLIYMIFVFSGIVGGIPFLILASGFLFWMRDKSAAEVRTALMFLPLIMIPILSVCLLIYAFIFDRQPTIAETLSQWVMGVILFNAFVLIFGYVYVGITLGVERLYGME